MSRTDSIPLLRSLSAGHRPAHPGGTSRLFGTGYSSLAYLRDLPIDELKLDRSFVCAMCDGGRAAALVASTIALAHSLGLRMVAEGVETRATYTELVDYGCDAAQGYFVCPPVAASQLDQWLAARVHDEGARVRPLTPPRG